MHSNLRRGNEQMAIFPTEISKLLEVIRKKIVIINRNTWDILHKENKYRLQMVVLISILYWIAYFTSVTMGNVFQDYAIAHHFNSDLYPRMQIVALRVSFVVLFLCLLKQLQSIKFQRCLLIVAMSLLVIELVLPLSLKLYPFMLGIQGVIVLLTDPWLQLYVPPALRATIGGLSVGLTGILDLSSVMIESDWSQHPYRYHVLAIVFFFILIWFWRVSNKKELKTSDEIKQSPTSIRILLTKHTYIFIAFLFGGLNTSIFSYTYLVAKEVLPHFAAQNYQYVLYIGAIIGPIVIGRVADRKGIFFITIVSACLLVMCKLVEACFFELSVNTPIIYYVLAFIGAGLAVGASTLALSLVGERLLTQGIFRAFAISNLFFDVGCLMAGRIYEYFAGTFFLTELSMIFVDIFLILFLWKAYKKQQRA